MDLRKIRKLIEIFNASKLSEIEISEGEESIRLTRSLPAVQDGQSPFVDFRTSGDYLALPGEENDDVGQVEDGHAVTSPVVGTFYAAASPDDNPFVSVGDTVEVGQPLCLIEAMKIYNEIEADCSGTVKQVLKKSGDPVEYGETLFIISE